MKSVKKLLCSLDVVLEFIYSESENGTMKYDPYSEHNNPKIKFIFISLRAQLFICTILSIG